MCAREAAVSPRAFGIFTFENSGWRDRTQNSVYLSLSLSLALASTHPISKIDLLFFTARARHFPPSLVILFSPSLQREPCTGQPPAVGGLHRQHPCAPHRAPSAPRSPGTCRAHARASSQGRTHRPRESHQNPLQTWSLSLPNLRDLSFPGSSLNGLQSIAHFHQQTRGVPVSAASGQGLQCSTRGSSEPGARSPLSEHFRDKAKDQALTGN